MSHRPRDWDPLRGSDPVPGDPDEVADEARYYGDVAQELSDQVRRLRRIGADDQLRGEYAERLRSAADELVGDLERVERRFAAVASALRGWTEPLRHAQARADSVLARAKEADRERRAHAHPLDLTPDSTPEEHAAEARRQRRYDAADDAVRAAARDLEQIEAERDEAAHRVVRQLDEAVDDDIKDGRFDGVKRWLGEAWKGFDALVTKYASLLTKIAEALSWVALAFAVLALCFTGVGLLAVLAVGLTAAAAVTRLALASTGNGSWADFGLEVFALLTFGTGKIATKGLKAAHAATAGRSAAIARAAKASTSARRAQLGRQLGRRLTPAQRGAARRELDRLKAAARRNDQAMRPRRPERLPVTRTEVLKAGGDELNAQLVKDMAAIRQALPSLPPAGTGSLRLARGSFATGAVADLADKSLGSEDLFPGKPSWDVYDDLKQRTTTP